MYVSDNCGLNKLRIYYKKGTKRQSPRYLIKCGDCNNSIEIYYEDGKVSYREKSLEINGVMASIEEWRKILLPLLKK